MTTLRFTENQDIVSDFSELPNGEEVTCRVLRNTYFGEDEDQIVTTITIKRLK